jgi:paraquat-inducible protein B
VTDSPDSHSFSSSFPSRSELPEVRVQPERGISTLWLIPLVAALLGIWLAYQHFSELGPQITISFETATGLEAGKTRIKYKDVDIGMVEEVELGDDLSTITVTATLDKTMAPYLGADSRFWVVRPRVGVTGISGLATLVSGAYIAFDPGSGETTAHFKGLEEPPVTPADAPGIHLTLTTDKPHAIDVGTPVYYKLLKVGRVDSRHLALDKGQFEFGVFINAPYDQLINSDTRFWNISGIEVSFDADGFQISSESLEVLLLGGITFDSVEGAGPTRPVTDGGLFTLYEDRAEIAEAGYTRRRTYVMYFEDSLRGLQVDAPVEFRGVKVGSVRQVNLVYDSRRSEVRIPVLVDIEPERITVINDSNDGNGSGSDNDDGISPEHLLDRLVLSGLRAQLEIGSLLTGQLYIALDMHADVEPATIFYEGAHPQFPTIPSQFNQLTGSVNTILSMVNDLPLQELVDDARNALNGIDELVGAETTRAIPQQLAGLMAHLQTLSNKVDDELGKLSWSIRSTMQTGRETLAGVAPDSSLYYELIRSLRELTKAAREIRVLADELERQPESLLTGKKPNR